LLATVFAGQAAVAEPIGVVTDSSGPLLVKTASGSVRVLAVGSPVELSDTLVSRAGSYASVTLTDHSAVALGPDTELVLEKYSFHEKSPQADEAVLRLSKGRVRVTSGILGTRDTDTFTLAAGAATIDIRRSAFIAEYVQRAQGELAQRAFESPPAPRTSINAIGRATSTNRHAQLVSLEMQAPRRSELSDSAVPTGADPALLTGADPALLTGANSPAAAASSSRSLLLAQSLPAPSVGMKPGLYVQVLDGMIHLTNSSGTQNFTAGQFGFAPTLHQPPVLVPANPGMQFTPPPSFTPSMAPSTSSASNGAKSAAVDCEVR
jgi:hypothetical protein